ncbi:hypothetical protein GCM10025858_26120 [Alicyclobacillus sacchari]|nr:hypothetical protein GCM10025858_26120 [Alicyclobacillus sacchari]
MRLRILLFCRNSSIDLAVWRRIVACVTGGGNTSAKTTMKDHLGRDVPVMWVKGSGSDLADATDKNFTALRLEDILPLMERDAMSDEEMVDYLTHCMMDSKHPRSSIETLLHAFVPFPHVDHTHPDSIIAICCCDNGREIAKELFGDRAVWVPYIRPGFTLSKLIGETVRNHPNCELVLMEKHGLITWGHTSDECYQNTLRIIQEAADYIERHIDRDRVFGGVQVAALPAEQRQAVAAEVLPWVRGIVTELQGAVLTFDDSADFLSFVGSHVAPTLSQIGAACPDHLVHTKRKPLFIDWNPGMEGVDALKEKLRTGLLSYRAEYCAYYERNVDFDVPMHDPFPRVILVPGLGVIGT